MSDYKSPGKLRYLAFGLLGLALFWAIITHSLVAALVRIEPSYALIVRSDDPAALTALADRAIDASNRHQAPGGRTARFDFKGPTDTSNTPVSSSDTEEDAGRREDLRTWASAILAQEPSHARALLILGDLKRAAGEEQNAATLMRASAQRTLRDPVPHAWLINEALKQKDWSLAMRHADIMMSMHERSIRPLTPLIAHLAETQEASSVVLNAIMNGPTWRTPFLAEMLNTITDARTPLELLLALKETPKPPTTDELRSYLSFLIQRGFFDLAYYTWLQFLSPQQLAMVGPLFNGSFEMQPSGLPFDWQLPIVGTASVSIARRPGNPSARALAVNFGHGRVELGPTSQLLRLRPGRYHVAGEVMGEVVGRRSVRWRVSCLGKQARHVGESEMFVGEIKDWTAFALVIDVPETDCAAQTLNLFLDARVPSERLISGTILFDEMSIRREPDIASEASPSPAPPPQSQPRQR
jgi:hypothetical protein